MRAVVDSLDLPTTALRFPDGGGPEGEEDGLSPALLSQKPRNREQRGNAEPDNAEARVLRHGELLSPRAVWKHRRFAAWKCRSHPVKDFLGPLLMQGSHSF
jgi:hypothetical protein